jgi:amino acid transporter
MILILFELLFTYRDPGVNAVKFFKGLFTVFLFTFLVLGLIISLIALRYKRDADRSNALWYACTDTVIAIFFTIASKALLGAVTYPMVQPQDVPCVNFCKVGIVVFVVLLSGRVIWNGTHYFGGNVMQDKLLEWTRPGTQLPDWRARTFIAVWYFIFDFLISVIVMIAVYLFKKHNMMFNENPYYTCQPE